MCLTILRFALLSCPNARPLSHCRRAPPLPIRGVATRYWLHKHRNYRNSLWQRPAVSNASLLTIPHAGGRACSDNRNGRRTPQAPATVAAAFCGSYVAAGDVSGGTARRAYATYIESFCRITNLSEQRPTDTRLGTCLALSPSISTRMQATHPITEGSNSRKGTFLCSYNYGDSDIAVEGHQERCTSIVKCRNI